MSADYRYVDAGSLDPPRPLGRLTRFVLGIACLWLVFQILTLRQGVVDGGHLAQFGLWPYVVLGVFLFPEVFSLGFSFSLSRRLLRVLPVAAVLVLALASRLTTGTFTGAPLGLFVFVWLVYTYGHLGLSLVLAAFLATPGCEMRAVPHLWTRLTGRSTWEHYCPGFFDPLDRWERGRNHDTGTSESEGLGGGR